MAYTLVQCAAAIGGAVLANVMFAVSTHLSTKHRASGGHLVGELVATAGLIALIFALARTHRGILAAPAVGAYIGAAYWFTSSTYLSLGTTAHKQGRLAGQNALAGAAGQSRFAGSPGTQVVKVFDLVAARTGLREHEATAAGFTPLSTTATPDDHKAHYPGAHPITVRITGDAGTGKLLGAQLIGARGTETAKRVDTYATALFHQMTIDAISELDLSYTPPLGSPWDAVQIATQAWVREHHPTRR